MPVTLRVITGILLAVAILGCSASAAKVDKNRIGGWSNGFSATHEADHDRKWVDVQTNCLRRAIEEHNRLYPMSKMEQVPPGTSYTKATLSCPGLF